MTLTGRQADVLGLLARGQTKAQVAALLGITEGTVTSHNAAAKKNLGARNTAHAVWIALNNRLIVG